MHNVKMTTLEIAKLTGKRHNNVLRDCKVIIGKVEVVESGDSNLSSENMDSPNWSYYETTYTDERGKIQPMLVMGASLVSVVIGGYSITHRIKVQLHIESLEAQLEAVTRELTERNQMYADVINSRSWFTQELGLKLAGINKPRKFMEFLKAHSNNLQTWLDTGLVRYNTISKDKNVQLLLTKKGFNSILKSRTQLNNKVDYYIKEAKKVIPY